MSKVFLAGRAALRIGQFFHLAGQRHAVIQQPVAVMGVKACRLRHPAGEIAEAA